MVYTAPGVSLRALILVTTTCAIYKVEIALIVSMASMAVTAICRVLSTVKKTNVTCRMDHVWSVHLDYIVGTAISRVQPTVKTKYVTCIMDHALHVSLGGLNDIVKRVRIFVIIILKIK